MHPSTTARDLAAYIRSQLIGMRPDDKIETLYELYPLLSAALEEWHEDAWEAGLLMPGFTEEQDESSISCRPMPGTEKRDNPMRPLLCTGQPETCGV